VTSTERHYLGHLSRLRSSPTRLEPATETVKINLQERTVSRRSNFSIQINIVGKLKNLGIRKITIKRVYEREVGLHVPIEGHQT